MYSPFQAARKFLTYWFSASNGKGHGTHSPFVYAFIRDVLMDRKWYDAYQKPEAYRNALKKDHRVVKVTDLGAGSVTGLSKERTISRIVKTSVKSHRYSSLLYRLGSYYGYRRILEMGTSLGVTTMYLAGIPSVEKVITMEGADAIADQAEKAFDANGFRNIELVRGEFGNNLVRVLDGMEQVDLAFIDGNHRKEPTLDYFRAIMQKTGNDSCIVFDDIHWSREMEAAWAEICQDERVTLSIDLFFLGIVFFRKEILEKQQFVIRY